MVGSPAHHGPWAEIGKDTAELAGFYLGNSHELIHRHTETVALNADDSCAWSLKIDFELPVDPAASKRRRGEEAQFLFPLMFLRKPEGHLGFYACDESGDPVMFPTREKSDEISALAASSAAQRLLASKESRLPARNLNKVFQEIASSKPYESFVILNELLHRLSPEIVSVWKEGGLIEDLHALMEHSILWLSIRGQPGERRVIEVGQEVPYSRRAVLRWSFGELESEEEGGPLRRLLRRRRQVLDTGKARYGRRAFRISFRSFGERLVRPLAWIPIQWEFPTVYTRRCDSYHFEVKCPPGFSPVDLRVTSGDGAEQPLVGRRTLGGHGAHLYLPGGRTLGELTIRVFVGVGAGAFPVLWFLAGALTSIILWAFAAADPAFLAGPPAKAAGKNEIAAGILLTVPAVLVALVVAEEGDVARWIWGARILLFVPALCSGAATSVLIGAEPFDLGPRSAWTLCAAVSTAATIPLATSWSISRPLVRRQLEKFNSPRLQFVGLGGLVALAVSTLAAMSFIDDPSWLRAAGACVLLLLAIPMLLLGTSRAGVPLAVSRRYVAISAAFAAMLCLVLGCIELRAAFDPDARLHTDIEIVGSLGLDPVALLVGPLVALATRFQRRRPDEIRVSPEAGRRILEGESIGELRELRKLRQDSPDSNLADDPAIVGQRWKSR